MKPNPKEILKAIEELPICSDGKDGVKKLIQSLGFELPKSIKLELGDRVQSRHGGSTYIIAMFDYNKYGLINLKEGTRRNPPVKINPEDISFKIFNLNEKDWTVI